MNEQIISQLTPSIREGICKILDVVLPGTNVLPSGREVDAQDGLLDRVLIADDSLTEIVTVAGNKATGESSFSLSNLQDLFGEETERLIFALHAAYYMSPKTRASLNYPGQQRFPISEATPDQICSEELIEPVLSRGPIYVPTPETTT